MQTDMQEISYEDEIRSFRKFMIISTLALLSLVFLMAVGSVGGKIW